MGHDSRDGVKDGKDLDEHEEGKTASTELSRHLDVEAIGDVMRRGGMRCHGHVEGKGDVDYVKACSKLVV